MIVLDIYLIAISITVVNKILSYLDKDNLPDASNDPRAPPLRAPPDLDTFSNYTIQHDFDFGA